MICQYVYLHFLSLEQRYSLDTLSKQQYSLVYIYNKIQFVFEKSIQSDLFLIGLVKNSTKGTNK